jgi:hypothetical protein
LFKSHRPKSLRQASKLHVRGSINLDLSPSMEEFINSSKYFVNDYSDPFVCHEVQVYENYVFVLCQRKRRFGVFKVDDNVKTNSIFKEVPSVTDVKRYCLREKFFYLCPEKVFDQYLIYFTKNQFIAFDYR